MKSLLYGLVPATLLLVIGVAFVVLEAPRELLISFVGEPSLQSYALFTLALALAVVAMPLTAMPLVPIGTAMFGPLTTAFLSIIGWTLGAVGAFLVARVFADYVLRKHLDLTPIDTLLSDHPVQTRFLIIILIRLTIPVDIGSYALGLTTKIKLLEYTLATLIGVSWFSFAFAYLGETLIQHNVLGLIGIAGISVLVFSLAFLYLRKLRSRIKVSPTSDNQNDLSVR